ncbi:hypothetical protein ACJX0J_038413 [Zea mays]
MESKNDISLGTYLWDSIANHLFLITTSLNRPSCSTVPKEIQTEGNIGGPQGPIRHVSGTPQHFLDNLQFFSSNIQIIPYQIHTHVPAAFPPLPSPTISLLLLLIFLAYLDCFVTRLLFWHLSCYLKKHFTFALLRRFLHVDNHIMLNKK